MRFLTRYKVNRCGFRIFVGGPIANVKKIYYILLCVRERSWYGFSIVPLKVCVCSVLLMIIETRHHSLYLANILYGNS